MFPAVLILSCGTVTPKEIAKNILLEFGQEANIENLAYEAQNLEAYLCDVKTKYYFNKIYLVPCDGKHEDMPAEFLKIVEIIIIYFDAKTRCILERLPQIEELLKFNKNIELGIYLTDEFTDATSKTEISYRELKEMSNNRFDIITLKKSFYDLDVDDECGYDEHNDNTAQNDKLRGDKHNYGEVKEALMNFIWSNIQQLNDKTSTGMLNLDKDNMEAQLNAFENMLSIVGNFRNNLRSDLTRDEFLDEAEKIAEVLETLVISENESGDSD